MPSTHCVVPGCTRYRKKYYKGLGERRSLFSIRRPDLAKNEIERSHRTTLSNFLLLIRKNDDSVKQMLHKESASICTSHFLPEDIKMTGKVHKLKLGAKPCLNLPDPNKQDVSSNKSIPVAVDTIGTCSKNTTEHMSPAVKARFVSAVMKRRNTRLKKSNIKKEYEDKVSCAEPVSAVQRKSKRMKKFNTRQKNDAKMLCAEPVPAVLRRKSERLKKSHIIKKKYKDNVQCRKLRSTSKIKKTLKSSKKDFKLSDNRKKLKFSKKEHPLSGNQKRLESRKKGALLSDKQKRLQSGTKKPTSSRNKTLNEGATVEALLSDKQKRLQSGAKKSSSSKNKTLNEGATVEVFMEEILPQKSTIDKEESLKIVNIRSILTYDQLLHENTELKKKLNQANLENSKLTSGKSKMEKELISLRKEAEYVDIALKRILDKGQQRKLKLMIKRVKRECKENDKIK